MSNNPQQAYCSQRCAADEEKARARRRNKMVLRIMEDMQDQVRRHPKAKRFTVRSASKTQVAT